MRNETLVKNDAAPTSPRLVHVMPDLGRMEHTGDADCAEQRARGQNGLA
jgi:hypothetical protein